MIQKQLIEGCAPPRPTRNSDDVIEAAAALMLPNFVKWLNGKADGDEMRILAELIDESFDLDGYQLARDKALSRTLNWLRFWTAHRGMSVNQRTLRLRSGLKPTT